MSLTEERKKYLNELCKRARLQTIKLLYRIQTGHPGGSLSAAEILSVLYFEKLNIDPARPDWEDRDRFILAKGHAAPMLYFMLAERGFFPKEELATLRQLGSRLQGHPSAKLTPGVELSTGPLGLGLPAGIGMALGARLNKKNYYTYVLMGDGETQEGIVWEAAMTAAKFKVDNMIVLLDNNGVQLDGTTDEIMPMGDIPAKWKAFGWNTITIDGHDVGQIYDAIDKAKALRGMPTIIISKTVKGKGVSYMEGRNTWHGKVLSEADYKKAMEELGGVAND